MESRLRDLLDKIYELEGLVHLALKRDDSSEDFLRLITKKGHEVEELCRPLQNPDMNPDMGKTYKEEDRSEEIEVPVFSPDEYSLSPDEYSLDEEEFEESEEIPEYIHNDEIKEEETPDSDPEPYIPAKSGRLVFSINDKFRFRKELFDNSDADFNTSLALVASMDDYEEAEDYFVNEEGFDKSNPVVADFLEIIKRYFK